MKAPQRVLVTGCSSGLGLALCRELLQRGCLVAGLARRTELCAELNTQFPQQFSSYAVDVADGAALRAAMTAAVQHIGGLDAVVANAGMGIPSTADTMRMEDVRRVLAVNVEAAIHTLLLALPHVRRSPAPLLAAVTSRAGWRAGPGAAPYCASKAALAAFLDSLRAELAHEGIAVLDIAPGFVRSAMTDRNAFKMPFLMETDAAARVMANAVIARRSHVAFPRPVAALVWIVRRLPDCVFDFCARRIAQKLRRNGTLGVSKAASTRK